MPGLFALFRPACPLRIWFSMICLVAGASWADWHKVFSQPGAFANGFLPRGDSLFAMIYNPDTAQQPRGFSLSTDHGMTWKPFRKGVDSVEFGGVVANAIDLYGILIRGENQVMRWSRSGERWVPTAGSPPHPILLAGVGSAVLAITDNTACYRSVDAGESWTPVILPRIGPVQAFFTSGNIIYVSGWGTGDIYRSTDEGLTWNSLDVDLGLVGRFAFAAMGNVHFLSRGPQLLRSLDDGATWGRVESAPMPGGDSLSRFRALTVYGNRLFSAPASVIYVSQDSGRTWRTMGENLNALVDELAISGPNLVVTMSPATPVSPPPWTQIRLVEEMFPTSSIAPARLGYRIGFSLEGAAFAAYDLQGRKMPIPSAQGVQRARLPGPKPASSGR